MLETYGYAWYLQFRVESISVAYELLNPNVLLAEQCAEALRQVIHDDRTAQLFINAYCRDMKEDRHRPTIAHATAVAGRRPAVSSPGPVDAGVGLPHRADVARALVVRLVLAGRHGEQPAQLVDACESLAFHPVGQPVEQRGGMLGAVLKH